MGDTVSLKDLKNGKKTGGSIKAAIVKVGDPRKAGDYEITDLLLDDGTGRMTLSLFDASDDYEVGKILSASGCYVKEYKDKKFLNLRKNAKIKLKAGGKSKDSEEDDEEDNGSEEEEEDDEDEQDSKSKKSKVSGPAAPNSKELIKSIKGLTQAIEDFKVDLLGQLQINAGIKKPSKQKEPIDLEADKKQNPEKPNAKPATPPEDEDIDYPDEEIEEK